MDNENEIINTLDSIDNHKDLIKSKNNDYTDIIKSMNKDDIIEDNGDSCNVSIKSDLNETGENFGSETSKGDTTEWLSPELQALQVKPDHWTQEYWDSILLKYKWFLTKDNFIGCAYCHDPEINSRRKGLIPGMKLYLLGLSFDDLENKLAQHRSSKHHTNCVKVYRADYRRKKAKLRNKLNEKVICKLCGQQVKEEEDEEGDKVEMKEMKAQCKLCGQCIDNYKPEKIKMLCNREKFECPCCTKAYKSRKSLCNHLTLCKIGDCNRSFKFKCVCGDNQNEEWIQCKTINQVDIHNIDEHNARLEFPCQFGECQEVSKRIVSLFGHYLMMHNLLFDPHNAECPPIVVKTPAPCESPSLDDNATGYQRDGGGTRKRNATQMNDFSFLNDDEYEDQDTIQPDTLKHRRLSQMDFVMPTYPPDNYKPPVTAVNASTASPAKYFSKLTIPIESVVTCQHCDGSYLSEQVLLQHIQEQHSQVNQIAQKNKQISRQMCHNRLNQMFNKQMEQRELDQVKRVTETQLAAYNKSAALLSCNICSGSQQHLQVFDNLNSKLQHIYQAHPHLVGVTCHHCVLTFATQHNYIEHMTNQHAAAAVIPQHNNQQETIRSTEGMFHACTHCALVFYDHAELAAHTEAAHAPPVGVPQDDSTTSFMSHTMSILSQLCQADNYPSTQQWFCNECESPCHNQMEYVLHQISHDERHSLEINACPSCTRLFLGERAKQDLLDHYEIEHRSQSAPQCGRCYACFPSKYLLERHISCCTPGSDSSLMLASDPYWVLSQRDRWGFCCTTCSKIIVGADSEARMMHHITQCQINSDLQLTTPTPLHELSSTAPTDVTTTTTATTTASASTNEVDIDEELRNFI